MLKANQCSDNKERLGDFYIFLQKVRRIGKLVTVLCLGNLFLPIEIKHPSKNSKTLLTNATIYGIIQTSNEEKTVSYGTSMVL